MSRGLDRPIAAAAAGLLVGLVIVGLGALREGGDISRFVRAAPPYADPAAVPAGLTTIDAGYDGMFYYRLALDPFTDRRTADGITLDLPAYRQQRIAYPLLAWALSLGDPSRIPAALVAVNVAGLAALGWIGGLLARGAGRHALWGAIFPAYPGFVMTLTRDLTEIVAAVAVLGALLLLRRGATAAGAAALAVAALARETTIVVAAAAGASRLLATPREPRRWLPLVLPALVLVGMQAAMAMRWGSTAAGQGTSALAPPFLGFLAAVYFDVQRFAPGQLAAWAIVVAFVFGAIALGVRSLRSSRPPAHEAVAWWAYVALATVLEINIWANGAVLRALTELGMLGGIFAITASARARWTFLAAELVTAALVLWAEKVL